MPVEAVITSDELRQFWKDPSRRRTLRSLREEDREASGRQIAEHVLQREDLTIDLAIWLRERDDRLCLGRWGTFTPSAWRRQIVGEDLVFQLRE